MALTRPQSHETGDGGERLFAAAVPFAWVPEEQSSDYGIDFFVLVPEAHLVTGLRFAAQVKTTARHPRVDGDLRVELEVAHLEYWIDQEVLPVFLVACDLADRQLYYADIDEIAPSLPPTWREQKTVTVSVSPASLVSDHGAFLAKVRTAWNRRMGPQAAVVRRQKQMQAIDPRFLVRITATADGELHQLIPKETIQSTFHLRGDERGEKLDRLLRGHRVDFGPGEVSIDNMPLLKAFADTGGSVEMARRTEATASLVAVEGDDEVRIANLPVTIIRAPKALRVESRSPRIPISFDLECVDGEPRGDRLPVRATFTATAAAWFGQLVPDLGLFDPVHAFVGRCRAGALVRIVLHLPGQDVSAGEQSVPPGSFEQIWDLLELIRLAREVCREGGINPAFPSTLSPKEEEEIRHVHGLLFGGEYRSPGSRWTMNITGTWGRKKVPRKAGDIEISMKEGVPEEFAFLGAKVTVNVRQVMLTKALLAKSRKMPSGSTRYTFSSRNGEFIQRSDRYPALRPTAP